MVFPERSRNVADSATCATIRPMQRRLTLLLMAALCAASCGSETTRRRRRRPGARLAIAPQPDFLTVGSSVVLEARLTEGTSPPRVVAADWSSADGRVAAVDRSGRVSALAPGTTTIRATFGADTASLAMRAAPDFAGTWTGNRRVVSCVHPRPDVCAAAYPTQPHRRDDAGPHPGARSRHRHAVAQPAPRLAVVRRQRHDRRARQPHAGRHDHLDAVERRLDDARRRWPTAASRSSRSPAILRGSFAEARTDADGTSWRVSWEIQGLTRTR